MHAKPIRPNVSKTGLAAVALATVLSGGCARLYHMMHYNCVTSLANEHHLTYYHSASTGRIIPKEHHQQPTVELPCFGYEPTCWHRWPAECVNCPVAEEIVVSDTIVGPQVDAKGAVIVDETLAEPGQQSEGSAPGEDAPLQPTPDDETQLDSAVPARDVLDLPLDDASYQPQPVEAGMAAAPTPAEADDLPLPPRWDESAPEALAEDAPNVARTPELGRAGQRFADWQAEAGDAIESEQPLETARRLAPLPTLPEVNVAPVTEQDRQTAVPDAQQPAATEPRPVTAESPTVPADRRSAETLPMAEQASPAATPSNQWVDTAEPVSPRLTSDVTRTPAVEMAEALPTFHIKAKVTPVSSVSAPTLRLQGAPPVSVRFLPEAPVQQAAVPRSTQTSLKFR